jgi:hypothetical protein
MERNEGLQTHLSAFSLLFKLIYFLGQYHSKQQLLAINLSLFFMFY